MVPTTREEFEQYCLRALGQGAIRINVTQDQVEDRIDEALSKFYERHFDATEETYILFEITDADVTKGYIELPDDILFVTDCFRPKSSSAISSPEYQYYISEFYGAADMYRYGDMTYYYMNQMRSSLMQRFFSPDRRFTFNPITKKLIIAGGLAQANLSDGGVVIKAFKKIPGEDDENSELIETSFNIWKNHWLQEYATALIKRQWGANLGKFQNVQLIGGVTMNGDVLKQEAKEEIEQLLQQLDNEYQYPVDFSWA